MCIVHRPVCVHMEQDECGGRGQCGAVVPWTSYKINRHRVVAGTLQFASNTRKLKVVGSADTRQLLNNETTIKHTQWNSFVVHK